MSSCYPMIVRANGVDLSAETFGDRSDPPILLIHGAGNSMLSWDERLCDRLAAGLLDALDVSQAHIVGLSVGCAIGQLLALDHADRWPG